MTCYNQILLSSCHLNQDVQYLESCGCHFHLLKSSLLFSTRGRVTAERPCTTLIMIPSAPLLLTSFEIVVILINLALFSYGYPDAARMSLWEEGGVKLFNSDPKKRIYFYANHQEPPEIPYIWSQT